MTVFKGVLWCPACILKWSQCRGTAPFIFFEPALKVKQPGVESVIGGSSRLGTVGHSLKKSSSHCCRHGHDKSHLIATSSDAGQATQEQQICRLGVTSSSCLYFYFPSISAFNVFHSCTCCLRNCCEAFAFAILAHPFHCSRCFIHNFRSAAAQTNAA